jgi:hypothetical protein
VREVQLPRSGSRSIKERAFGCLQLLRILKENGCHPQGWQDPLERDPQFLQG